MLCWFKPFSLSVCLTVLSTLSCRTCQYQPSKPCMWCSRCSLYSVFNIHRYYVWQVIKDNKNILIVSTALLLITLFISTNDFWSDTKPTSHWNDKSQTCTISQQNIWHLNAVLQLQCSEMSTIYSNSVFTMNGQNHGYIRMDLRMDLNRYEL